MTRLELRNQVIANTNRSELASDIDTYLQLGVQELQRLHKWRGLRQTLPMEISSGEYSVILPSATKKLLEVRLQNGQLSRPIAIKAKSLIVSKYPNISEIASGYPVVAYEEEGQLTFLPPSNGTYTLLATVLVKAQFLQDDSDNPIPWTDDCLIAYGTHKVYQRFGQYRDAEYWRNQFEMLVLGAIRDDEDQPAVERQAQPMGTDLSPTVTAPHLDPFYGMEEKHGRIDG